MLMDELFCKFLNLLLSNLTLFQRDPHMDSPMAILAN
jgi:hypothetical protein